MNVKLSRWGNSLAIRIPSAIAKEASLREGNALSIEYEKRDGSLRLALVENAPSLDDLVSQITADNVHDEVDFGEPVGREAW